MAAGNPKGVRRLDDLLRDDVKVGLANPDAAAVGRATRSLMRGLGRWKALATKAHVMKPTVESLVNDLKLGAVDVAVLWDATVGQYEELDIADIPELADGGERQVTVGVLDSSEVPAAALRFARYLGARDRGLATFQSGGFRVVNGDPWAVRPRLVIYSGAMLRPGISATLEDFQRREACEIETVYNGCGVLVASMANARIPDAYLACDTSFMDQVADRFLPATLLTENDLVILVKRGNPDAVKTLEDLAREGLRVGLAHVQNSALGALTKRLLESLGLWGRVVKNRAVDSATGDFLVNQIIAGRLDAVVVYRSNALAHPGNAERLEIVDLDGELAYARQSWAVAKDARYPQLLGRLFDRVHRGGTRARFRSVGFRWIGPKR
ncbi:MAG: hypothetical protein CMJ83_12575 [Planctomycetes bacterium]|nr:hypothetical protein [Planctomycetota bacterium]